jgi:hypothetical protein
VVPVLLCILVLVLSSGAVLGIVLEREDEPTGATPPPPQIPARQAVVAPRPTGRALVPALPRHRARSSALLVVLVLIVGVLLAALVGTALALAAFALRSAVTS